ncbi:MAG: hypothetical protein K0Q50_1212 [Vampirovibrio sp.]|jgi:hypothetical protein|nr:hypothetical protein [Vampirovibrio sp.]
MNGVKAGAALVAVVMGLSLFSGCNKSDTGTRSEQEKPINQTFGKSYVKEIPESKVQQKEVEMTSPQSEKKGPAVGEYDPNKPADQQHNP